VLLERGTIGEFLIFKRYKKILFLKRGIEIAVKE
jgi:hypothetical protein